MSQISDTDSHVQEETIFPEAPPPSLASIVSTIDPSSSSSLSYSRPQLLSLAQTPKDPFPERLDSISQLLRRESNQWGIDESHSNYLDVFDNEPISKALPIPVQSHDEDPKMKNRIPSDVLDEGVSDDNESVKTHVSEIIFEFKSPERARPIMINLNNPFTGPSPTPTETHPATDSVHLDRNPNQRKASSIFQEYPMSLSKSFTSSTPNSLSSSLASMRLGSLISNDANDRYRINETQNGIGIYKPRMSRINSNSSNFSIGSLSKSSTTSSNLNSSSRTSPISRSISISNLSLNPFAPPFPLPESTPRLLPTTLTNGNGIGNDNNGNSIGQSKPNLKPDVSADKNINSIPLPKVSSLPPRPPGPVAPVYVRRESAVLPQSMALPSVPPLGKDWESEEALSRNERRRRGSLTTSSSSFSESLGSLSSSPDCASFGGSSGSGGSLKLGRGTSTVPKIGGAQQFDTCANTQSQRPERLVKLGQRLRESVANRGVEA